MLTPLQSIAWRPGLPLEAKHFDGLEDYLLYRTNLRGHSPGIDKLQIQKSLKAEKRAERIWICVQKVTGLTPGGCPVALEAGSLETALPPGTNSCFLDLHIHVWRSPGNPLKEEEPVPVKYTLSANVVKDESAVPTTEDRLLYLGRWQLSVPGLDLRLARRPPVRRLLSLEPGDDTWLQDFIKPLNTKLQETASSKPDQRALAHGAIHSLLSIAMKWRLWDIAEVAMAISEFKLYSDALASNTIDVQHLTLHAIPSFNVSNCSDTWPRELGERLISPRVVASGEGRTLLEGIDYKFLSVGPKRADVVFLKNCTGLFRLRVLSENAPKTLNLAGVFGWSLSTQIERRTEAMAIYTPVRPTRMDQDDTLSITTRRPVEAWHKQLVMELGS